VTAIVNSVCLQPLFEDKGLIDGTPLNTRLQFGIGTLFLDQSCKNEYFTHTGQGAVRHSGRDARAKTVT
jgi:hypothetical protein